MAFKIPENGTVLKLSTFNKKFGLNYKTANDFCFKFLKPVRINLTKFNALSFNYKYKKDSIFIIPYNIKATSTDNFFENKREKLESSEVYIEQREKITRRLNYFRKRYGLKENEMIQLVHQYKNIPQIRELIEKAFKEFVKINRLKGAKSTEFQGKLFLNEIQKLIIQFYRSTKMGELVPNGYPMII